MGAQARGCVVAVLHQPEHAAGHGQQEAHPGVEHLRRDLVGVAEGAEHEALVGQAQRAAWRRRQQRAPAVGRQVAVRQAHHGLAVEALVAGGYQDRVADHIVHERQTAGAGKADVVRGDRHRVLLQHAGARMLGVAVEVDGDVDAARRQVGGDLRVAPAAHVDEAVEGAGQPPRKIIRRMTAVGVAMHLEALAVVQLEDLGQHPHHRVLLEIRREVGQPDARGRRP